MARAPEGARRYLFAASHAPASRPPPLARPPSPQYTAKDGTCKSKTCTKSGVTVTGFTDVPTDSQTALMTAIVQQPISIAVEADQASFQSYSSGVMTAACGTNLDHGVLAVGYGADAGKDYYQVKNSWGADWGSKGYIWLARGPTYNGNKGQCGIQMDPSYPATA